MEKSIPQEWMDVLSKVQSVFPGAVIAGGALRDLNNQRPIKDVDIFIPIDPPVDRSFEDMWDLFGMDQITLDDKTQYGVKSSDDDERDLYAIFRLHMEFYDYDLILCTRTAANMENFDINICQIKYDGEFVHMSHAYLLGCSTKTIKVMNINRSDRNKARVKRLLEKYPDFTTEDLDE